MSFREKSAWLCLITTIVVFVPYFTYVMRLLNRAELTAAALVMPFIAAVFFQTVFLIGASIAISIRSKEEKRDERDVMIELKAFKYAYYVFACFIFMGVGLVFLFDVVAAPTLHGQKLISAFLSQVVLFCFVAAEIAHYLIQVVSYRRGY